MPYHQLRTRLLRDARLLRVGPAEAEDLVQKTLEKGVRAGVASMDHPYAWLRRTLINHFVDQKRRQAVEQRHRPLPSEPRSEARDEQIDLNRALEALPEEQANALVMVLGEGRSYEEVARCQGVPANTVKSRVFRARRAVMALVAVASVALLWVLWPSDSLREALFADHTSLKQAGAPDRFGVPLHEALAFLEAERSVPPGLIPYVGGHRVGASSCTLMDQPVGVLLVDDAQGRISTFAYQSTEPAVAFPGTCETLAQGALCEWRQDGWTLTAVADSDAPTLRRRLVELTEPSSVPLR